MIRFSFFCKFPFFSEGTNCLIFFTPYAMYLSSILSLQTKQNCKFLPIILYWSCNSQCPFPWASIRTRCSLSLLQIRFSTRIFLPYHRGNSLHLSPVLECLSGFCIFLFLDFIPHSMETYPFSNFLRKYLRQVNIWGPAYLKPDLFYPHT